MHTSSHFCNLATWHQFNSFATIQSCEALLSDKRKLNITFVKRRPQRDSKNHISAVVAVAAHCNNDVYYHSGLQCHNRCSALLRTMRNSPTNRRRDSILMRSVCNSQDDRKYGHNITLQIQVTNEILQHCLYRFIVHRPASLHLQKSYGSLPYIPSSMAIS